MTQNTHIPGGTAHQLPKDLESALRSSATALPSWEGISPLARNEWICWVESVKKAETRLHHIHRAVAELSAGKRRPCCWMGCPHRTDKPINATQRWILAKQSAK